MKEKKHPPLAILTGASSGLGQALAPKLAKSGFGVCLVGRSAERLARTAERLPPGTERLIVPVDLAEGGAARRIVEAADRHFRQSAGMPAPVACLINAAGRGSSGRIEDIPLEEHEQSWRLNYLAPVALIREVLPRMKAARSGIIVNVSSGVAKRALPFVSPYASAKAALEAFTESLRSEVSPLGLRVLLFSPGPIATGFHLRMTHFGETALSFPPFRGKDPDAIATRLLRAITGSETRVRLGYRANLAVHLNYWTPNLMDMLVERLYRLR